MDTLMATINPEQAQWEAWMAANCTNCINCEEGEPHCPIDKLAWTLLVAWDGEKCLHFKGKQ